MKLNSLECDHWIKRGSETVSACRCRSISCLRLSYADRLRQCHEFVGFYETLRERTRALSGVGRGPGNGGSAGGALVGCDVYDRGHTPAEIGAVYGCAEAIRTSRVRQDDGNCAQAWLCSTLSPLDSLDLTLLKP
jgi:hypothetical protein